MFGIAGLILVGLTVLGVLYRYSLAGKDDIASPKTSEKLTRLWGFVDKAARAGSSRALEKALLAILRIDHKNTAAYNRLGMVYARLGNLDDAVDCFAIASSLTPTVATLYNLGLVEYERGHYKEAVTAFERVVDLEPNAKRYIAYAKALYKLGEMKSVADVLEKVVQEDPDAEHYTMLAQAYKQLKEDDKAEAARREAALLRAKRIAGARRRANSKGNVFSSRHAS